jgi:hypothetical protein
MELNWLSDRWQPAGLLGPPEAADSGASRTARAAGAGLPRDARCLARIRREPSPGSATGHNRRTADHPAVWSSAALNVSWIGTGPVTLALRGRRYSSAQVAPSEVSRTSTPAAASSARIRSEAVKSLVERAR